MQVATIILPHVSIPCICVCSASQDVVDQEAAAAEAAEAAAAPGAAPMQEDGPAGIADANGTAGQPDGGLSWGGAGWVKEGVKQEDSQVAVGVKRKLEDGEESKEGIMRAFM
jgi:hypothetical protein